LITVAVVAGMIATPVGQQTRKFRVRLTLGVAPVSLLLMMICQGFTIAIVGLMLGLAEAIALVRLLLSTTFTVVSLVLPLAALTACLLLVRRTIRVDLMTVLRAKWVR